MKNFDESKLKQEFSASADLQAEFGGDVEAYIAFKLAEAEGRVQISRPVTSGPVTAEQFHAEIQVEKFKGKIVANEAELKRLDELQGKSEANQYSHGTPCQA